MELQEQSNSYTRDLRSVAGRLSGLQRENRATQATMNHLSTLKEDIPLYRAVGKAFVSTSRTDIDSRLENEQATNVKNQRDLTDRQEYLERRIASNKQNMKDLTAGL